MKLLLCSLLLLTASWLAASQVQVRVVDEAGRPLSGATVRIAFTAALPGAEVRREGLTDSEGRFSGSGQADFFIMVRAGKEGYYSSVVDSVRQDRDADLTLTLRKVIQPIPLFARRVAVGGDEQQKLRTGLTSVETYRYDLAMGEMLPPHGRGQRADIIFVISSEFVGWRMNEREMADLRQHFLSRQQTEADLRRVYGNWRSRMELRLADPGAGLIEVRDRFLTYSELQMPHQAPEEGYVAAKSFAADPTTPPHETSPYKWSVGYFLRVRTKLDAKGRVISAHYAKVMGDFYLYGTGHLHFCSYFNPTPNDRNLEFDLQRNLSPREVLESIVPVR